MRVLALVIAFGVAAPAWAQIEDHSSGFQWKEPAGEAKPGGAPRCTWCIGAELGLAFAGMLVGGAIGFGINLPRHDAYGGPIWIGASLGLVAGSLAAAWATGSYNGHPEWLGAALGGLAGAVLGGGGAFLCFLGLLDHISFNGSDTANNSAGLAFFLLGVSIAAVVPVACVVIGIEVARSHRVSAGVAPLPGGGGAAVFRGEF